MPSIPGNVLDRLSTRTPEKPTRRSAAGFLIAPRDETAIDEVRPCVNEQNRYHALDPQRFPRTAREAYYLGGKDLRFLLESVSGERGP